MYQAMTCQHSSDVMQSTSMRKQFHIVVLLLTSVKQNEGEFLTNFCSFLFEIYSLVSVAFCFEIYNKAKLFLHLLISRIIKIFKTK